MAFVEINPRYRHLLARRGLSTAEHFLDLPGVIISGHPDRHVCQASLDQSKGSFRVLLKREHRVPLRDRLTSAGAGFGWVSKSVREARTLRALRRAGVGCPEWIAAGEDGRGRAFLLIEEVAGGIDLRIILRDRLVSPRERRRFARSLGEALARMHRAGFDHPDLCAKHVLVDPDNEKIIFLDWQRSRKRRSLGWRERCRDLALLHATLADELATSHERLVCLRAYLRSFGTRPDFDMGRMIHRLAQRYLRRRHVREQRQPPLTVGTQNLIWMDGESLCVTREFLAACGGRPGWLVAASRPDPEAGPVTQRLVPIPGGTHAWLVCRRSRRPGGPLWTWLRRRSLVSPELRSAGLLFRLQRHGIRTARLLAVGQREFGGGWMHSFLLAEPIPGPSDLREWLPAEPKSAQRNRLLRDAGALLRRLHNAGCFFSGPTESHRGCPLVVQQDAGQDPAVAVVDVSGLELHRRPRRAGALRDLRMLRAVLSCSGWNRTDTWRMLRGYLGPDQMTAPGRRLARKLLADRELPTAPSPVIVPAGAVPCAGLSFSSGR